MPLRALDPFRPIRIASERELRAYIARTTAFCAVAALGLDVVNQLVFFEGWTVALRSWAITVAVVVVVATPVTRSIARAHLALFRASQTDPLTGLLNRRALLEDVDDRSALMVLMIADIDRFKSVNDRHGHLAGDRVLRLVADIMRRELGDVGRVGRLGGEEFALICRGWDEPDLLHRLERFRETVALTPALVGAEAVSVTISAGVASRAAGQSFEQLYAEADRALYRAKTAGRNRIVVAGRTAPARLDLVSVGRRRART